MGGIESSFQFLSYKIDRIDYNLTKTAQALAFNRPLQPDQIEFSVTIRNPVKIPKDRIYLGGINVKLSLFSSPSKTEAERLLDCEMGIEGLFKVVGDDLSTENEDSLVRVQIPAILFPYIRSEISTVLAGSGFGGVIMPLINVQKLAETVRDKLTIEVR